MKPLRILHFTENLDKGGLEQVVFSLAKYASANVQVTVACQGGGTILEETRSLPNVRCILLPRHQSKWRNRFRLLRFFLFNRFDIVDVHYCLDASIVAILCRQRVVETVHNVYGWLKGSNRRRFHWICHHATGIIAVSNAVRTFTLENFPIKDPAKARVIPNGVDPARCESNGSREVLSELGIAPDRVVVGTISALAEAKNLELFIRATPGLQKLHPEAAFLIVGGGYWEEHLRALVSELGAPVCFAAYTRNIGRYLSAIDIFVLPSWYEGFPLTLLEAAFSRKAIVAAPVGPVPELIRHGENGLILSDYELSTFTTQVASLLEAPQLRQRMGEEVYRTVVSRFDIRDSVKKAEAFFLELAGSEIPCPICSGRAVPLGRSMGGYPLFRCGACTYRFVPLELVALPDYNNIYSTTDYQDEQVSPIENDFDPKAFASHPTYRPFFDALKPQGNSQLLDVGCGVGRFCHAATEAGWQVEGIDISAGAIEIGKTRAKFPMTQSTVESHLSRGRTYDVLTAFEVMEHTPDPVGLLRQMAQLIRPQGQLFITVPDWNNPEQQFATRPDLIPPVHIGFHEIKSLRTLLEAAGFRNIRLGSIGGTQRGPGFKGWTRWKLRQLRRRIHPPVGIWALAQR